MRFGLKNLRFEFYAVLHHITEDEILNFESFLKIIITITGLHFNFRSNTVEVVKRALYFQYTEIAV